jgi:tRNA pseudouridine55 synthase
MNGILLLDKPKGLSSAALVAKVKKKFSLDKVGHGGTLDPMATGLLPIAVNEGTKIVQFLLDADKEYIAEATLGATTDTDDAEGSILQSASIEGVTPTQIKDALAKQVGSIEQRPPIYSALKRGGKPLYQLAREGKEVEVEARTVEIKEIELLEISLPIVRFRVACGKGTYIRSVARDLGEALGCGGHLSALRRTRAHRFDVAHAKTIEDVATSDAISCAEALSFLPSVVANAEGARRAGHGQKMPASQLGFDPALKGFACVLTESKQLIAIAELDGNDGLSWQRIFHS